MLKKWLNKYAKPTPAKWRKIGDSLMLIGGSLTAYMIEQDDHNMAKIALVCTILGKVITNFASDESVDKKVPDA